MAKEDPWEEPGEYEVLKAAVLQYLNEDHLCPEVRDPDCRCGCCLIKDPDCGCRTLREAVN